MNIILVPQIIEKRAKGYAPDLSDLVKDKSVNVKDVQSIIVESYEEEQKVTPWATG